MWQAQKSTEYAWRKSHVSGRTLVELGHNIVENWKVAEAKSREWGATKSPIIDNNEADQGGRTVDYLARKESEAKKWPAPSRDTQFDPRCECRLEDLALKRDAWW